MCTSKLAAEKEKELGKPDDTKEDRKEWGIKRKPFMNEKV